MVGTSCSAYQIPQCGMRPARARPCLSSQPSSNRRGSSATVTTTSGLPGATRSTSSAIQDRRRPVLMRIRGLGMGSRCASWPALNEGVGLMGLMVCPWDAPVGASGLVAVGAVSPWPRERASGIARTCAVVTAALALGLAVPVRLRRFGCRRSGPGVAFSAVPLLRQR